MIDYTKFPNLQGVYLEDSFVLNILESPGQLTFKLEAVLTPEHPSYHEPQPGQQYCYADGDLKFTNVSRVEWVKRTTNRYRDAAGEEDLGNIDSLILDGDTFVVEGDWGEVRLQTETEPRFELATR